MLTMRIILTSLCWFCLVFHAQSQETPTPSHYVCYKADSPLTIDGNANEKSWKKAAWTDDFKDITGDQRLMPRFRTRAKMLWDNEYFYVFAEICEPHIWANLKQRDTTIYNNNDFEVFIDPDGDTHRYYEYEMNALNTQWDLLLTKPYRDRGIPVTSWNFENMNSAVHIEGTLNNSSDIDQLWSVEIAFPMKSMRDSTGVIPVKDGDQWRVNFSRVEWQTLIENGRYVKKKNNETGRPLPEDNWVWSPQGSINMHIPDKWGYVQFSDHMAGSGITTFLINPQDAVKNELRVLYYEQQKYHSIHHKYAGTLNELGVTEKRQPPMKFGPAIKATPKEYEVTAKLPGSDKLWHIDESGRVWAERTP